MIKRVKAWLEEMRIRRVIRSIIIAQIGEQYAKIHWLRVREIACHRAKKIAAGESFDTQIMLATWDAKWLATASVARARMLVVAKQVRP